MVKTRGKFLVPVLLVAFAVCGALLLSPVAASAAPGSRSKKNSARPVYELRLFETHRDKTIDIVYRVGNHYLPSALHRLDYFLRDHLNGKAYRMDPKLFDLLHKLTVKLGRPKAVIDVICGYRTPATNTYLREHTDGVAKHSLHMKGEAIDIRIPGVPLRKLRKAARELHLGGVGYYPGSDFVHVDVGPVRQWALKR